MEARRRTVGWSSSNNRPLILQQRLGLLMEIANKSLKRDAAKEAGNYAATFNAANLSNSVYIYGLQASNYTATKKLMLLK
jgi:hypothetical protein